MTKLILAECERIWARKSTKVLLIIMIAFQVFNFLLYQGHWKLDMCVIKKGMEIELNNLNYPVTQLIDFNAVLIFLVLPLFFTESLSLEIDTGAYKMMLLRPIKKWKLIVSKWIALVVTYSIALGCVCITKCIIGNIFMPKVNATKYFFIGANFSITDSILYNVKYYLIVILLHVALIGVISLISVITRKPVLTFLGCIFFIIASLYLCKPAIDIFFNTTNIPYYILAGQYNISSIVIYIIFSICCALLSLVIWNKKIGEIV